MLVDTRKKKDDDRSCDNSLGLAELVFYATTHIVLATSIIFILPVIALKSGPAMPISFLFTTIVCCFIANTVAQFPKFMPSSGGLGGSFCATHPTERQVLRLDR